MPIYEYECTRCKTHVEVMQKMVDKPLSKCTKCGGRLEKQWSSTSFQLKGTGWYVTDYAAKKSETKAESKDTKTTKAEEKTGKAEEKTSKVDGDGSSTKAETKTDSKQASTKKKNRNDNASSGVGGD